MSSSLRCSANVGDRLAPQHNETIRAEQLSHSSPPSSCRCWQAQHFVAQAIQSNQCLPLIVSQCVSSLAQGVGHSRVTCYLAFVVDGSDRLEVAFPRLLPRLPLLTPVRV